MIATESIPGYLTTDEAAERIGVDASQVRRYCLAGLLDARKAGNRWMIPAKQVRKFKRPPVGNPNFRK